MDQCADYKNTRTPKSGHRVETLYQLPQCDTRVVLLNRCDENEYEPFRTFSFNCYGLQRQFRQTCRFLVMRPFAFPSALPAAQGEGSRRHTLDKAKVVTNEVAFSRLLKQTRGA